ncbi:hypothetical protein ACU686_26470 [Yinghuangia aomiensis]
MVRGGLGCWTFARDGYANVLDMFLRPGHGPQFWAQRLTHAGTGLGHELEYDPQRAAAHVREATAEAADNDPGNAGEITAAVDELVFTDDYGRGTVPETEAGLRAVLARVEERLGLGEGAGSPSTPGP